MDCSWCDDRELQLFCCDDRASIGLMSQTQLFPDQLTEAVFDLAVSRDWCPPPGSRILVDVVSSAVPLQIATRRHQLAHEGAAVHSSNDTSFVLTETMEGGGSSSAIINR